MLKDMFAGIVKYGTYGIKNNVKSVKVCFGPMMNQLIAIHPDTIRLVYQSGKCEPLLVGKSQAKFPTLSLSLSLSLSLLTNMLLLIIMLI